MQSIFIKYVLQIPPEPEKMREWMYNLYYEKDEMLAKYYETGVFPYDFHKNDDSYRPREVRARLRSPLSKHCLLAIGILIRRYGC